jgi:glycosyltransferase involved in cell wall biosynthesis
MSSHSKGKSTWQDIKIAYIHRTTFPSTEANTFDAIWSASALSENVDITFFVPRLKTSLSRVKEYYEISSSPLKFQSMHLNFLPDRFLLRFKDTYENLLAFYLRFHPQWAGFHGLKVLYVREPKELLFWGLQRKQHQWMKDWLFCYEAHDPLGLNPNKFKGLNPFELKDGSEGKHRQEVLKAALNFDAIICNTLTLAEDLRSWTNNVIKPHVITLASPLSRLENPPQIHFGEKIIIGYIGTIDQYRGVNTLLDAMYLMPKNIYLRIVGRFRQEEGVDPDWLSKYCEDPLIKDRVDINLVDQIRDVAGEIDRCDIVIQPASHDVIDSRYAAPLKSYGYMIRGKPIVAGDVPSHRELFKEGKNAVLYHLDPHSLADCIVKLVNDPDQAEQIAINGWKQSAYFTFSRKVAEMLTLFRTLNDQKALQDRNS